MTLGIGWYVHDHGSGHLQRARTVLPHLTTPAALLTAAEVDPPVPDVEVVPLPSDVGPDLGGAPLPSVLHHAPVGVPGLRARVARLTRFLDEAAPALVVVDVSVEVTLLCRLAGVPVVTVRQHGDRTDPAHAAAYEASTALLAPWPPELEDGMAPDWVVERTWHVGGFSRFDGRSLSRPDARRGLGWGDDERVVVATSGTGGAGVGLDAVAAAAAATPGWRWCVLGRPAGDDAPPGVELPGFVADPFPHLRAADVVVAGAGHNTVMECAAAGTPLVVLPEERPFDEQRCKARALQRIGAAEVLGSWPDPDTWPAVLDRARAADPSPLAGLVDGRGAERAAGRLDALVAELTA